VSTRGKKTMSGSVLGRTNVLHPINELFFVNRLVLVDVERARTSSCFDIPGGAGLCISSAILHADTHPFVIPAHEHDDFAPNPFVVWIA